MLTARRAGSAPTHRRRPQAHVYWQGGTDAPSNRQRRGGRGAGSGPGGSASCLPQETRGGGHRGERGCGPGSWSSGSSGALSARGPAAPHPRGYPAGLWGRDGVARWLPTCGPLPTFRGSPVWVLPTEPSLPGPRRPHPTRNSPLVALPSSSVSPPSAQPLRLHARALCTPVDPLGQGRPPRLSLKTALSAPWPPAPITPVLPCSRNSA